MKTTLAKKSLHQSVQARKSAETCDGARQIGKWNAQRRNLDVRAREGERDGCTAQSAGEERGDKVAKNKAAEAKVSRRKEENPNIQLFKCVCFVLWHFAISGFRVEC